MQRPQDIQRGGRGVETDAITDATIAGRVIGENQGNAFFRIRYPSQIDPAPRQLGHEIHALRLWPVANNIRLAALTAPCQVLETDRAADDASIQLRQRDMHRQITRAKSLFAGAPTGLVVLGANRLDHRNIAAKRAQMGVLRGWTGRNPWCSSITETLASSSQSSTTPRQPGSFRLASAIGNGFNPAACKRWQKHQ